LSANNHKCCIRSLVDPHPTAAYIRNSGAPTLFQVHVPDLLHILCDHQCVVNNAQTVCIQIRELHRQLESRDELIGELRAFKETSKDAESRQSAVILSLRQRVLDCEAQQGALDGVASRSEHALAALQRECHESQQQILRLESDLRYDLSSNS
jgi:hypothetical protein